MIIVILFSLIFSLVTLMFSFLPDGNVLPFGTDNILVTAVQTVYAFIDVFPPIGIVFQAFSVFILYKIGMLILRLFIGHRAPN